MVLYLIGLGLGDEKDITIKGLEAVKKCSKIYLEAYTSILGVDKEKMEALYGKKLIVADREMAESDQEVDRILNEATEADVAFLVVGDPFGATTHSDLVLRAYKKGVKVEIVHNASIVNAVGCTGLQLYNFGQIVSIVFFTETWKPDSFYDKIKGNKSLGLHTLCLLDIKVKEQSIENLIKGKKIYEPPRYMTVNLCVKQLLEVEETKKEGVCREDTLCFGLARIGHPDQKIVSGTLKELLDVEFGPPLHSFIITGNLHALEAEMFNFYRVKK